MRQTRQSERTSNDFGARARHLGALLLVATAWTWNPQSAAAQEPVEGVFEATQIEPLAEAELQELVGPIALYPDDLVSIILPASTYPLQIVQAARFLDDLEADASLEPDPEWDNAVVALLNYPEVLRQLDADLDWTWSLGQAVLNQQADVIDAVQAFRDRAYTAGNLQTDDRQVVTEDDGVIEIEPADPEVIYVPYYDPAEVVVVHRRPAYYYYDYPYPVYYYPYPYGYRFGSPFFWGVTSAFLIGWHTHYLHVYHHSHYGHPYYRYPYYAPYYARRGVNININLNSVSHVWRPNDRHTGGRPYYGNDNRTRYVRSTEDYARDLRRSRQRRTDSGAGAGTFSTPRSAPRSGPGRELATSQRALPREAQAPSRTSARDTSARNRVGFTSSNPRAVNDSRSRRTNTRSNGAGRVAGSSASRGITINENPNRLNGSAAGRPSARSDAPRTLRIRPSQTTRSSPGLSRSQARPQRSTTSYRVRTSSPGRVTTQRSSPSRATTQRSSPSRATTQRSSASRASQRTHTFAAPARSSSRAAAPRSSARSSRGTSMRSQSAGRARSSSGAGRFSSRGR